jgi:hypothetical protein
MVTDTVVPWFSSGNVLVIQSTLISKGFSPEEIMETQMVRSKTKKIFIQND